MKPIQADTHIPNSSEPNVPQALSQSPSVQTPLNDLVERTTVETENQTFYTSRINGTNDTGSPATMMNDELLSTLFSGNDNAATLVRKLLYILHELQKKTTLKQRFHLFVETDQGLAQNSPEDSVPDMHRVQTRIAFSPTLSSSYPQQTSGLSRLYGELIQMSFAKAPTGTTSLQEEVNRTPTRQPIRISGLASFLPHSDSDGRGGSSPTNVTTSAIWTRDIAQHLTLMFPKWCPYPETKYTPDEPLPPESSHDYILLEKGVVDIFRRLEDFQIAWVYQELFKFIHQQGRKNRRRGMARTLTYSQFTPPWLRQRIIVKAEGEEQIDVDNLPDSVTLKNSTLTHLRNERNTQGFRRIRFILAAFYIFEPDSIKPLLDHLLRVVPHQRGVLRRKGGSKRRTTGGKRNTSLPIEQTSTQTSTPRNANCVTPEGFATPDTQRNETIPTSVRARTNASSHNLRASKPPLQREDLVHIREDGGQTVSRHSRGTQGASKIPKNNREDLLSAQRTPNASTQNRSISMPPGTQTNPSGKRTRSQEQHGEVRQSVFHGIMRTDSHSHHTKNQDERLSIGVNQAGVRDLNTSGHNEGPVLPSSQAEEIPNEDTAQPKRLKESVPSPSEYPGTPFSPSLHEIGNLQCEDEDEDEEEENDEEIWNDSTNPNQKLEENMFSGAVKCGALALCPWFAVPTMQRVEIMQGKCAKCKIQMHRACHKTHPLCNFCRKKYFVKSLRKACKQ